MSRLEEGRRFDTPGLMTSGANMLRLFVTAHDCIFLLTLSQAGPCSPRSSLPSLTGRPRTVRAICSVVISRRRSRCCLSLWGPLFTSFVTDRCRSSSSNDNAVASLFCSIRSTAVLAFISPSRDCYVGPIPQRSSSQGQFAGKVGRVGCPPVSLLPSWPPYPGS